MSNAPLLGPRSSTVYRELGWSVIPVDADSKKPLVFWKPYATKAAGLDDLERWGRRYASRGIAVVTGAVSRLVVLDADGEAGVREALARGIPRTPTVRTPRGGMHFYFQHPGFPVSNGAKLGCSKALDVRGEHGYVLAPHSKRSDGRRYVWGMPPVEVAVAPSPPWFLEMLKQHEASLARAPTIRGTLSGHAPTEGDTIDLDDLLGTLPDRVHRLIIEGCDRTFPSRSECDLYVCIQLVARGVHDDVIQAIFDSCEIGSKYREPGQGDRYLGITLEKAHSKIRTALIKHADLNDYGEGRRRLFLALTIEGSGQLIRCGVSVPSKDGDVLSVRWGHLFDALGLPVPIGGAVQSAVKRLPGRKVRIELDHRRDNPVGAFYRYVE